MWRWLTPLFLSLTASGPPQLPSISDTGALVNASQSDWRAILIAIMFLFLVLIVFVIWREILNWRLTKSLDKIAEALIAVRIAIIEGTAENLAKHSILQALIKTLKDKRGDK